MAPAEPGKATAKDLLDKCVCQHAEHNPNTASQLTALCELCTAFCVNLCSAVVLRACCCRLCW